MDIEVMQALRDIVVLFAVEEENGCTHRLGSRGRANPLQPASLNQRPDRLLDQGPSLGRRVDRR